MATSNSISPKEADTPAALEGGGHTYACKASEKRHLDLLLILHFTGQNFNQLIMLVASTHTRKHTHVYQTASL